jgi:energy-coupling factor transporter ATP-binding protein EcfA2
MPIIDITVDSQISTSIRAKQLSSMFDIPPEERHKLEWKIDAPWEDKPWSIGLIVGPSGSGKTTIMRHVFGEPKTLNWGEPSVIDDFGIQHSIDEISGVCSAVGFNTVPAWLRPFYVLSNGEQFRVTLARLMLDAAPDEMIVVDEFTSVVDRQVAKIGANAVQKWVRKNHQQFVAVSCHYDIKDWLQPDWVIDVAKRTFSWRSVQPRPRIEAEIRPADYALWSLFAPYHYMSAKLHRSARCYAIFVNDEPVAFTGIMRRPHPKAKDIMGISRIVTLPDWQGLGLAFILSENLGACYKVVGERLRNYPAHPAYIRAMDRSPNWSLKQKPGYVGSKGFVGTSRMHEHWHQSSRPNAVFEYCGPAWSERREAEALIERRALLDH